MTRRVLAFLIFLIAGGTVAPLAQSPQSPAKTGARLGTRVDLALTDRLSRADDASVERVIIRMKPGTKRALLSQLQAQGARVSRDFNLIEAFAGEVPAGMLRALQNHPDVLAMSADAEMHPMGLTTTVTGAAANTPYALRRTLWLETISGTAVTRSFQQGASGYAGTTDGGVKSSASSSNYGNATSVLVEVKSSAKAAMLLRFDNLFGSGANQIPVGSTITSATLRVSTVSNGSTTGATNLHRMLTSWAATPGRTSARRSSRSPVRSTPTPSRPCCSTTSWWARSSTPASSRSPTAR